MRFAARIAGALMLLLGVTWMIIFEPAASITAASAVGERHVLQLEKKESFTRDEVVREIYATARDSARARIGSWPPVLLVFGGMLLFRLALEPPQAETP